MSGEHESELEKVINALAGDVLAQEAEERMSNESHSIVELSAEAVEESFERFLNRSFELDLDSGEPRLKPS